MSEVTVTVAEWRQAMPEFANTTAYPDTYMQRFLTEATMYISTKNFRIRPEVRVLAIEYMAGHLLTLAATDGAGNAKPNADTAGSVINSASIDSVSVSLQAVIAKDAFEQWIQSTPYGKAYWALLTANNPTGVFYVGNLKPWGIK